MNTILNVTPENKIDEWAGIIKAILASGKNVIMIGDTETTGTYELGNKKNFGKKDRVLEIGFLFYVEDEAEVVKKILDSEGNKIFFHEYVNPFKEDPRVLERYNSTLFIPQELVERVHGIDIEFLLGKKGLVTSFGTRTDFILSKPAPTFREVKPFITKLANLEELVNLKGRLKLVAHNGLFDVQFMNAEWKKTESYEEKKQYPSLFEAYIETVDTKFIAERLYKRAELKQLATERGLKKPAGYSLDFLQEFYGIVAERDMHGALLDSEILAEVYKSLILDERYQSAPVVKSLKGANYKRPSQKINGLVKI